MPACGLHARLLLAPLSVALALPSAASAFDRAADPVVTTGAAVPTLVGADPRRVVAFAWGSKGWDQVPVQVDQRKLVDLRSAYPASVDCAGRPLCYQPGSTGPQLRYADPGTLIGSDPDPRLDADDELAMMARDAGKRAPRTALAPSRVRSSSRREVVVGDPLDHTRAYLYLFQSDGRRNPSAGRSYVNYRFGLAAGAYPAAYNFGAGPNAENSTVTTRNYRRSFSDRWRESGAAVTAGNATGVNVLDRNEAQFAPDYCGRTTLTFARGEGAYLVNRSGPVRAIRSVVGANSGPMSEREQVFYDSRTDETTTLRVHPIPGVMSFWDYSAAASGMRYANNSNPAGVLVDGRPDAVAPGPVRWETMDGPQGAVTHVFDWKTTLPLSKYTSFYRDDAAPRTAPCEGDADGGFHGASGPFIDGMIGTTDGTAPSERLVARRITYFAAPGQSRGEARDREVRNPLAVSSPRARKRPRARVSVVRIRAAKNGALRIVAKVNGPGRISGTSVKGRRRVGTGSARTRKEGTVRLTVRLNRTGRRLARAKAFRAKLTLRFKPAVGAPTSRSRTVRVARR